MKKDDYVVLKHIVSLIPQLDLSDNNNYTYGVGDLYSLSVFAADSYNYVGYNNAGAIIFKSKNALWHGTLMRYIARYGSVVLGDKANEELLEELDGVYTVTLNGAQKEAFIQFIKTYKERREIAEVKEADDVLSKQMLNHIKGGNKND